MKCLSLPNILAALLISLLQVGCAGLISGQDRSFNAAMASYSGVEPSDFSSRIASLQASAAPANGSVSEGAHLRLALLHSHYKNPAPDYQRALKEINSYLALTDRRPGDAVLNFSSLLREIARQDQDLRSSREKVEVLRRDIARLEKEIARLDRENREARDKLDQLKQLDIQFEEKRKSIR